MASGSFRPGSKGELCNRAFIQTHSLHRFLSCQMEFSMNMNSLPISELSADEISLVSGGIAGPSAAAGSPSSGGSSGVVNGITVQLAGPAMTIAGMVVTGGAGA